MNSVLSQTYPNIEIVAVDDGSTDSSRQILNSYGMKIRVLNHPGFENRGQSAAINLAIRLTDSEYIAILDSDDLWEPNKIERQVDCLIKNPDVGLVYSNGYAIDEEGKKLYTLFPPGHKEMNMPERVLIDCYFSVPSNSLIRRSAFKKAGDFDESLRSAQDHDMAIRLSEVTNLEYLDEPLWYYRRHKDTQSQKHSIRRWNLGFKILSKACKRHHYSWNIRRRRLAVLYYRLGQCWFEERKIVRSLGCFAMAGLLDPVRSIKVIIGIEKKM